MLKERFPYIYAMLSARFPIEIILPILTFTNDASLAIKIESVLHGLPFKHPNPSKAFLDMDPKEFPASMKLSRRSTWKRLANVSLCEMYWIARFRPHVLMWDDGALWKMAAGQSSLKMFVALLSVKEAEGFPMALMDWAIEKGNVEAVEYLWENQDICYRDHYLSEAARNGHTDMMRFLHEEKGVKFPLSVYVAAAEGGNLETLRYIGRITGMQREALPAAASKGHVHIVRYFLDSWYWIQESFESAVKEAAKNGHYKVIRLLASGMTFSANRIRYLKAVAKALLAGEKDFMPYFTPVGRYPNFERHILATGDVRIVKLFHGKNSSYCDRDFEDAAANGHLDIVRFLCEKKAIRAPSIQEALHRAGQARQMEVLAYLAMQVPDAVVSLNRLVWSRKLEVVEYVVNNMHVECSHAAMDNAASIGLLDIVQYLHKMRPEGCTTRAMDAAAENGHFEAVKWLHENRSEGCTTEAMDKAAANNHFDIVKFLHRFRDEGCTTDAMDMAAARGHLGMVKWLHENRSEGCTSKAMDLAAKGNHLSVIQFLHWNRSQGCTINAVHEAVWSGKARAEVLRFLLEYRSEGCKSSAMRAAAVNKDLSFLWYLHKYLPEHEGWTAELMDAAAGRGLLDNVKFLHKNRTEGCTCEAFKNAIREGHLEVIEFLVDQYPQLVPRVNLNLSGSIEVFRFLFERGMVVKNEKLMAEIAKDGFIKDLKRMKEEGFVVTEGMARDLWESHSVRSIKEHLGVDVVAAHAFFNKRG
ncbi:hypothetical protein HDU97_000162 [Phlyctochytrium planicorne]|nr:hypothetical protein HDU97_000162 [Phlyctochytrium planicorne]